MSLAFFKFFFRMYFHKSGWSLQGKIPNGIKKAILVGGAHTSNWDFVFSLGTLFILDINFKFIIKREALIFPLKNFLLSLGALPVDRSSKTKTNYVDQLAHLFSTQEEMFLCIAPEGTRKAVSQWKTGYYHIAKKANLPIIVCHLDYQKKIARIGNTLYTDAPEEIVTQKIKESLKEVHPKIPENFAI